jgi:hypothetical protein
LLLLSVLWCSLRRLGDAGACALAALIAEGTKLSSLQLCGNDIGDDGMVALAQVRKQAPDYRAEAEWNGLVALVACCRGHCTQEHAIGTD